MGFYAILFVGKPRGLCVTFFAKVSEGIPLIDGGITPQVCTISCRSMSKLSKTKGGRLLAFFWLFRAGKEAGDSACWFSYHFEMLGRGFVPGEEIRICSLQRV